MSLITVNALPSYGSVSRDDVYHWRQTHSYVAPYSALPTPIDNGYWVVPYADYLIENPDATMQNGWLFVTDDIRDLPVALLSKSLVGSLSVSATYGTKDTVVSNSVAATYSSYRAAYSQVLASCIGHSETERVSATLPVYLASSSITQVISAPRAIDMGLVFTSSVTSPNNAVANIPTRIIVASGATSAVIPVRSIISSGSLGVSLSTQTTTLIQSSSVGMSVVPPVQPKVSTQVGVYCSYTKDPVLSQWRDISFIAPAHPVSVAAPVGVSFIPPVTPKSAAQIGITFSSQEREIIQSATAKASITLSKDQIVSNTTAIVIPVKQYVSDYIGIGITALVKPYVYPVNPAIGHIEAANKVYVQAAALAIGVDDGSKAYTSSASLAINVPGIVTPKAISTSLGITFVPRVINYAESLGLIFDFHKTNNYSATSHVLPIHSTYSKKYTSGYSVNVDVFGTTPALEVTDQEWVLLKKLGTQTWRFLSVLDEKSTQVLSHMGAELRLHEVLAAMTTLDVTYTSFNEVEHVTWYKGQDKVERLMELQIDYSNQFPYRATLLYYDAYDTKCYEYIQTFTQGIAGDIVPDTFVRNILFNPNTYFTVTTTTNAVPGMAVYAGQGGVFEPAIATSALTANVYGVITNKTFSTSAFAAQFGEVECPYGNFTAGNAVFLSDTIPGHLTHLVPSAPGHIVRRVGYALSATRVMLDIQQTQVIRAA